jgi:hypothetical protein
LRLLVVIPHYSGPPDPANNSPIIGAYLEPLSRIAAVSETVAALHRHFGPFRNTFEGAPLAQAGGGNVVDIVFVTMRGRHILDKLGLEPSIFSVEYVDGPPTSIPFHVQRLLKERLGRYDFYCLMEDDLAIHDPTFFAKLRWFQDTFGLQALLVPTRVEVAYTGTPAKVVVDPCDIGKNIAPFRRAGQRAELSGVWNGGEYRFALPSNPHAASYFLTQEQLAYWVGHSTFDDRDASWMGPMESAVTLGIGKAFDIYKGAWPDPFFLEVFHYGITYAARHPPNGRRHGEPPLLAIAQGAMRALEEYGKDQPADERAADAVASWVMQGTAGEAVGALSRDNAALWHLREDAVTLSARIVALELQLAAARGEHLVHKRSLRSMMRAAWSEIVRRASPQSPANEPAKK